MDDHTVDITRILRRMRGGSQAHLVEGNDGAFYVAKFCNNPQGNRTLVNEWIAGHLLQRLNISTPSLTVLRLNSHFKQSSTYPCFQVGEHRVRVEPGLHLGSECPVDPNTTAIFDFLPQHLISKTINLADFAKILTLDIFLAQTDTRQAIFVRERSSHGRLAFRAFLIDHGMAFGGSTWTLADSALPCIYWDRSVYSSVDTPAVCEHTLKQFEEITGNDLYWIARSVPRVWLSTGDDNALTRLMTRLDHRKTRLRTLVLEQLNRGLFEQRPSARGLISRR